LHRAAELEAQRAPAGVPCDIVDMKFTVADIGVQFPILHRIYSKRFGSMKHIAVIQRPMSSASHTAQPT